MTFTPEVRRVIYTTNAIEAPNRQIRKAIKTRGHFPDEQAATKLIYLAIRRTDGKWQQAFNWIAARQGLKIPLREPTTRPNNHPSSHTNPRTAQARWVDWYNHRRLHTACDGSARRVRAGNRQTEHSINSGATLPPRSPGAIQTPRKPSTLTPTPPDVFRLRAPHPPESRTSPAAPDTPIHARPRR
jgi:Transposase, Mutator family